MSIDKLHLTSIDGWNWAIRYVLNEAQPYGMFARTFSEPFLFYKWLQIQYTASLIYAAALPRLSADHAHKEPFLSFAIIPVPWCSL